MTHLGYILMTLGLLAMFFAVGNNPFPVWVAALIGFAGIGISASGAWMAGLFRGEDEQ